MRLQKMIAAAGITSRRKAEGLILDGRVRVNGEVVTQLGTKVDPNKDTVTVDGKFVQLKEDYVYYLFYKPIRVITSVSDPQGRRVVTDFFPKEPRIFPVGRLDFSTSGLLILTNDGEFMNRMIHPKHEIDKTYRVLVKGRPSPQAFHKMSTGIALDGRKTYPALIKNIVPKGNNCEFLMTIHEGRNRQIRRMCEAIGHQVVSLKRIQLGSLTLKGLKPGDYRPLTKNELHALRQGRS